MGAGDVLDLLSSVGAQLKDLTPMKGVKRGQRVR